MQVALSSFLAALLSLTLGAPTQAESTGADAHQIISQIRDAYKQSEQVRERFDRIKNAIEDAHPIASEPTWEGRYDRTKELVADKAKGIVVKRVTENLTINRVVGNGAKSYIRERLELIAKENGIRDPAFVDSLMSTIDSTYEAGQQTQDLAVFKKLDSIGERARNGIKGAIAALMQMIMDAIAELERDNAELAEMQSTPPAAKINVPAGAAEIGPQMNEPDFGMDSMFNQSANQISTSFRKFDLSAQKTGLNSELAATIPAGERLGQQMDALASATIASGVANMATATVTGLQQMRAIQEQARASRGQQQGGSVGSGKHWVEGDLYYEDAQKTLMNNNQPMQTGVTIRYNTDNELQGHINNYKSQGLLFSPRRGDQM